MRLIEELESIEKEKVTYEENSKEVSLQLEEIDKVHRKSCRIYKLY